MKKIFYTLAVMFLMLLSSCNDKEFDADVPSGTIKKREVSLTINNDVRTRVSHEEISDIVNLKWNVGDEILVESVDAENTYYYDTFILTGGEGTSTGIFAGSIPDDAVTLNAYYPAAIKVSDNLDMTSQRQQGDASLDHLGNYDILYATGIDAIGNDISIDLLHKGVLFTMPVLNSTGEEQKVIGVTLTNEKNDVQSSVFAKNVQISDGEFIINNTASLTLGIENGNVADGEEFNAYIMVCMEDLTSLDGKILNVIVHTEKGRYTITKNAVEFIAGTRYTLSNLAISAGNFEDVVRLVGNATEGEYDITKAQTLHNNNDGTYTWSGPLKIGDFKFIDNAISWGDQKFELTQGGNNKMVVNDYDDVATKFISGKTGYYDIIVNFNNMSLSMNVTPASWVFPIGDATPYGWDMDKAVFGFLKDINGDGTVFKGNLTLGQGKFKFLREAEFEGQTIYATVQDQDLSGEQSVNVTTGDPNDYQWLVTANTAGNYDITIDLQANTIIFEKKETGAKAPGFENDEF